MNLMVEHNGEMSFSIPAFRQVMHDYSDRVLDHIYIGRREGFMDELEDPLRKLVDDSSLPCQMVYGSPNQVINQLAGKIENHIGG
jgi:CRISPR-associated protein Cst2